ncbi:MAG: hypothetical protein LBV67_11825, partial [Streptococcaceae bacterium]|nr:hypothetical protein [Streptococcaceae bacterium]
MKITKSDFSTIEPHITNLLNADMYDKLGRMSSDFIKIGFHLEENDEIVGGINGTLTYESFHINGLAIDKRFRG